MSHGETAALAAVRLSKAAVWVVGLERDIVCGSEERSGAAQYGGRWGGVGWGGLFVTGLLGGMSSALWLRGHGPASVWHREQGREH